MLWTGYVHTTIQSFTEKESSSQSIVLTRTTIAMSHSIVPRYLAMRIFGGSVDSEPWNLQRPHCRGLEPRHRRPGLIVGLAIHNNHPAINQMNFIMCVDPNRPHDRSHPYHRYCRHHAQHPLEHPPDHF
ncbi:hypothetical protein PoB_003169700 [Plakobranchus ocellatus]|uniref:Uncharacterized protein n=1 Tax=Plakobranchus ocellatus TaxID=259542 RepID=A0AAV4ADW3_9GAST|nr:hypothetical protein PoB_003169700 [Plakobranchus ocellatus]